ncbi:MAG: homoserine dehydrogenase, partial [Armatimonadetes bacterium]|nr:homoserine dehydrogenase [Armatimonadota bacterium]
MADVSIGIIGYGIVGSGTYHILTDNADEIAARAGCCLRVAGIAD